MILRAIKYRFIHNLNDIIIFFFGKWWKVILINEYPKCGASWLKSMLGELLEVDGYFINRKKNHLPLIRPKYFIQRHWLKHTKHTYKTIIVIRDPRDVYNSFYFFENFYVGNQRRKLYDFDENADEKDNMFNYLKSKILFPEKSNPGFSHKEFWNKFKHRKDIYFIKYEDMRQDTFAELKKVLEYLGFHKDDELIRTTVENHTLSKMKKIENESDERKKFVRKGIVGDWKNNFNDDSIALVKKHLGEMIVEMGYEKNENW